jgi:hypothetical protein
MGPDVTFTDETQITHEFQQREEFAFSAHKNESGSVQERNFEKKKKRLAANGVEY